MIALALFPILLFLVALVIVDSYKLVRFPWILLAIAAGALAAAGSYGANLLLLDLFEHSVTRLARYGAPLVEETAKAVFLIWLIQSRRIGFLVDAAIFGFAIGTGFALVENLYYLQALAESHLFIWTVRGFGTAVMHGGATAICGILAKILVERWGEPAPTVPPPAPAPGAPALSAAEPPASPPGPPDAPGRISAGCGEAWHQPGRRILVYGAGVAAAVVLHSVFNHFLVSPAVSTLIVLLAFPVLVGTVFAHSEKVLREWLGAGFDSDTALLELLDSGDFPDSPLGRYLQALRDKFPGPVVADMICYIRLHVELWIRAKGILLLRGTGLPVVPDPEVPEKFEELRYLERSIGRTGRLAIAPFIPASGRDLWQILMVGRK